MQKVLLLDGYNMLYRARYGFKVGENPAIYAFFRSFRSVINKFKPDITYFVLEGYPKRRNELMDDYKGQREYDNSDDFRRQKRKIIQMVKDYFPVNVVRHPDYECDDVLASLAYDRHPNDKCVVVSTDTDFLQMLQNHKHVKVYNPIKKKYAQAPDVDYVSLKSLVGDKADNIPGFVGIGKVRGTKLLEEPGKLEEFLSEGSRREKYLLNREMIEFHDLSEDIKDVEESRGRPDWQKVYGEFAEMGFGSIIKKSFWPKFQATFDALT